MTTRTTRAAAAAAALAATVALAGPATAGPGHGHGHSHGAAPAPAVAEAPAAAGSAAPGAAAERPAPRPGGAAPADRVGRGGARQGADRPTQADGARVDRFRALIRRLIAFLMQGSGRGIGMAVPSAPTAPAESPAPEAPAPAAEPAPAPVPEPAPPAPEPALAPAPVPEPAPAPAEGPADPANARTFALVNESRAEQGLPSLAHDAELEAKAQAWAEHLAAEGRIYHSELADGVSPGYRGLGENVGYGGSVEQVHEAYLDSEGHRENILNTGWTHLGTGTANGTNGRVFTVHVFMERR